MARAQAAAVLQGFSPRGRSHDIIGVGGTFTTLAALHMGVPGHHEDAIHGSRLTIRDIDASVTRLAGLTLEATEALRSVPLGRAPVLLGGAIVASEALMRAAASLVTVSVSGLLEGLTLELARPV